jgi:hypothetical protein
MILASLSYNELEMRQEMGHFNLDSFYSKFLTNLDINEAFY